MSLSLALFSWFEDHLTPIEKDTRIFSFLVVVVIHIWTVDRIHDLFQESDSKDTSPHRTKLEIATLNNYRWFRHDLFYICFILYDCGLFDKYLTVILLIPFSLRGAWSRPISQKKKQDTMTRDVADGASSLKYLFFVNPDLHSNFSTSKGKWSRIFFPMDEDYLLLHLLANTGDQKQL